MQAKLPALTGVRGIAASWVVLLHYQALFEHLAVWPNFMPDRLIASGYLAVDLFFILSGYVLALSYVERLSTTPVLKFAQEFYLNRVFRILPLNWICLIAFAVLVGTIGQYYWTAEPLDVRSFMASFFLVQSWGLATPTAWNQPAWSLSAEWLAYAVFPIAALGLRRLSSQTWLAIGVVASFVVLAAIMVVVGDNTLDHTWRLGLVRCLLQFGAGMLLWRWRQARTVPLRTPDRWLIGGIILLFVAIYAPGFELLAPAAFGAIIVACASSGRLTDAMLGNRVVLFLGDISFSLYLTHFVLLGLFVYSTDRWDIAQQALTIRVAFGIGTIISVLAVATATWGWIEMPGQRAGRALGFRRRAEAPVAVRR